MAATIKIKNSSTASAVPTSSDLVQGELAVNVTDKRIFTENASGTVVELGTNPSILTLPDGSASAPTLTNDGDTNTGIFFPAADTVGITTGGTERARVDSSGNLGLGVTPSAWQSYLAFQMNAGSILSFSTTDYRMVQNTLRSAGVWKYINNGYANAYLQDGSSGGHAWYNAASGTAGNAITFTQAMTLDASGNLGVGTTSPTQKLDVVGSGAAIAMRVATTSGNAAFVEASAQTGTVVARLQSNVDGAWSGTLTNHAYFFQTNGTERARIDTSGNLLVGKTSDNDSLAGLKLSNTGGGTNGRINCTKTASGTLEAWANYYSGTYIGGISYSNTATSFPTSSDVRLKKDIVDAGSASAKIDQIRIVSHGWKHDDEVVEFGVVAQELVLVAPQAVNAGDDGEEIEKTWGVDYSKLVPMLIKAHQEQQAIITQLQADVAALKG